MAFTFPNLSSGSMKVYGSLASQAIAKYPTAIQYGYVTRVVQFLGDQEQRFLVRGELFAAILKFTGMNGYDTSVLRTFFRSMAGMASSVDLTMSSKPAIAALVIDPVANSNAAKKPINV